MRNRLRGGNIEIGCHCAPVLLASPLSGLQCDPVGNCLAQNVVAMNVHNRCPGEQARQLPADQKIQLLCRGLYAELLALARQPAREGQQVVGGALDCQSILLPSDGLVVEKLAQACDLSCLQEVIC